VLIAECSQETTTALSQPTTEPAATIRTSDNQLFCCKSIDKLISESETPGQRLQKTLGPWSLTALGIGAVIGSGIFVLTGTAAAGEYFQAPSILHAQVLDIIVNFLRGGSTSQILMHGRPPAGPSIAISFFLVALGEEMLFRGVLQGLGSRWFGPWISIGLVNVLMTIVAMWLIDHAGRRPLLLIGIAGMIVSLGVLGFVFRMPTGGPLAWLAVVTLMVYVASFAISLGPIFWLLISEIYPLRVRGIAEGTAAGVNWTFNFLVSFTFLTLVEVLGPSLTFWVYALLAIASWLFSYYLVPETKGRTLEEIEHSFRHRHAA